MKNMKPLNVLVIIIIALVIPVYVLYQSTTQTTTSTSSDIKHPIPFDQIAPKTTLTELKTAWITQKLPYVLPTILPSQMKSTACYSRADEKGNYVGVVIICYSAKGYEKIGEAELTLQITPGEKLPLNADAELKGKFITIGGYPAYYDGTASNEGDDAYVALYGKTCRLLTVNINNYNYWFRAAPSIEYSDLVKSAESMRPIA